MTIREVRFVYEIEAAEKDAVALSQKHRNALIILHSDEPDPVEIRAYVNGESI